MPKLALSEELARAIARDSANAQARKAGREAWAKEDYNTACRVFHKLLERINQNELSHHTV